MRLDLLCAVFVIILTFACMLLRDGKKALLVLSWVLGSIPLLNGLSALNACLIGGITCHGVVPLLDLGAGDVGLTLSYAISIVGMFQWGVRQSAEVENLVSLLLDSLIRTRDWRTQSCTKLA